MKRSTYYVNEADKCSVEPVPAGMLEFYRVHSCWAWAGGHPRHGRFFLLGREGGSPLLIEGDINGRPHIAQLPRKRGTPQFDKVTASCVTLGYRSSVSTSEYSISTHRLVSECAAITGGSGS